MAGLPPPPINDKPGSFTWLEWYRQLRNYVSTSGSVPWYIINFAGSNITDIALREHSKLQGIQGGDPGQQYHLNANQYNSVVTPSHGAFLDNTTQTAAAANTAYAITYNTTVTSSGVNIGSPSSRLICNNAGLYNFDFSLQIKSTSASAQVITIWPRINGVDVVDSATIVTISGSSSYSVTSWNFMLDMANNDYFELMWATDNTNVTLPSMAAQTVPYARPSVPAVLMNVTQIKITE